MKYFYITKLDTKYNYIKSHNMIEYLSRKKMEANVNAEEKRDEA